MNRKMAVAAAMFRAATTGFAHEHGEQWTLANEYPATSLPGVGDAFFARAVADATEGRISVITMPDAKLGYRSREQLRAVAEGRTPLANTFGGAIAEAEPIFGLSSLPFVVTDLTRARALYDAARPAYEAAFARHNQKLLWSTPWPASGLWTRAPANSPEAVRELRVRTYDATGTDVFTRMGATAAVVSFADLPPKLESGDIDAVLSSGDGGAGRKLWEKLPRFIAINYAIPLSFTTVNLDKWKALDEPTRRGIEKAAAETEARQWAALDGRLAANYARMRDNGMTIETDVPEPLRAALREAARGAIDDWARKAGAEGRALLERR
jgi:TRAP-type C4-dicarboxylate transport system substrate-binding protein